MSNRIVLGSLGGLAILLASASLAWACVPRGAVAVSPGSGPSGTTLTVDGSGFPDREKVDIRWDSSTGAKLGEATGPDFSVQVTIPSAAPGVHYVKVATTGEHATHSEAAAPFEVTAPPPPPDPEPTPTPSPTATPAPGPTPTPALSPASDPGPAPSLTKPRSTREVLIASRTGRVIDKVVNPNIVDLQATYTITSAKRIKVRGSRRRVSFGTAHFDSQAESTVSIGLTLGKNAKRLLESLRKLEVIVKIDATAEDGRETTSVIRRQLKQAG